MITDNLRSQFATSDGEIMTELKPCPFCGKTDSLEVSDCGSLEECGMFEECGEFAYKTVVCNVNKKGCGATSGYASTKEEAIEKWNTRTEI